MSRLVSSKLWKIREAAPGLQSALALGLNISPVMAQLLINRGVSDIGQAECFLSCALSKLHDPFLLKDMDKAVARLKEAQKRRERVLIYGDYDVDGITSIALLNRTLEELGLEVVHHIPHRIDDGYGLNLAVSDIVKEKGAALIICVDCGITAAKEVDMLNKAGVDVIIIDHHEPGSAGLPSALAIIDPKRKDCRYPFKDLAAVGLVLKFVQALTGRIDEDMLDLVTLGTVADVVPLTGENRIIVKNGLDKIARTKNVGLAALLEVTKIKGKKVQPHTVGFILGPRLNATGRMDSAHRSLDLLLSCDQQDAMKLALALDHFNAHRQKIQRIMIEDAIALVEQEINFKEHKVIVVSKAGWHRGVLGIVAARVAEKYSRPAIVISLTDGLGSASARSIENFHLYEALSHCSEFLEEFGGHRLAAGLTIKEENIDGFKVRINAFANSIMQVQDFMPSLVVDCELPLSAAQNGLIDELDMLEPYGEGNPVPIFCSKNVVIKSQPVLRAKDTIKFWVTDGRSTVAVVGFGMGRYCETLTPGQAVDILYQLTLDEWNGMSSVQLKLKDIKTSE